MAQDGHLGRIVAGRYRLLDVLGAGAHGTVYRAEDLGRGGGHVALKLVTEIVGGSRQEPADEILRHFRHPGWAAILDAGALGEGGWFQALQLVVGRSADALEDLQPPALVYRLLEDGARVLGALHRAGLIHYDVTPGNVILHETREGPRFVLTDGGLAHVGPVRGIARGTPLYMAPEVTEDGVHDHRADLYSLGLVAFHLLTGRDPFEGGAGEILGRRRREAAPRTSSLRQDVPPELDQLVADLLARDPRDRPHDAFSLLERIAKATGRPVELLLHEEGLAAAEGGPLVGRTEELKRFDEALQPLKARREAGSGRLAQARTPPLHDPVLVIRGTPGAGASRLVHEMHDRARAADVPVLLVAGRDSTGDRRGPLRHLVDAMESLSDGGEEPAPRVRLDHRDRASLGHEERAHARTRAVEQFLKGVEKAAGRTPFLIVVRDFADLPARAQEAVRVLSRHLLARQETGGSAPTLPVVLVVDLGSSEAETLLAPDTQRPDRPLVAVPPLSEAEILAFLTERFPGLEPGATDLERIHHLCEGLPGILAALVAEGCRRGDLRHESGRWTWAIDRIEEYDVQRGLSPLQADALCDADADTLRLLGCLSLVEGPLAHDVVEAVCGRPGITRAPASSLLRTVTRGSASYLTTTNLAVKKAVLARLPADLREALTADLITVLDREDDPDTALDRARLHAASDDTRRCIAVLAQHWVQLSEGHQQAAQAVLASCASSAAPLPETRRLLASLLEHDVDGGTAAEMLAQSLPDGDPQLEVTATVVNILLGCHIHEPALSLIERSRAVEGADPGVSARIEIACAVISFRMHRLEEARAALRRARRMLRPLGKRKGTDPDTVARYLLAEAQSHFLGSRHRRARAILAGARVAAVHGHSLALRAKILNSMGIIEQQLGSPESAEALFEESLGLRRDIGDVRGLISSTINLGRVLQHRGTLVRSTSLFQAASSVAQRYRQSDTLAVALRLLAEAYDQQLNARLACSTLMRVYQLCDQGKNIAGALQAAWALAPLATATGDYHSAQRMLRASARAAHARATTYARATHHLTAALCALHGGRSQRARVTYRRALRYEAALFGGNRELLQCLGPLVGYPLGTGQSQPGDHWEHPTRESPNRDTFRTAIWLQRSARPSPTHAPVRWGRFVPIPSEGPLALGRDRRIMVDAVARACRATDHATSAALLSQAERLVALSGEQALQARVLALRALEDAATEDSARAQQLSRALHLLDPRSTGRTEAPTRLPDEVLAACGGLAAAFLRQPEATPPHDLQAAHAMAHRLLLGTGLVTAPDQRVASALRRVLAATGRMNAGAGLDDLLAGMTGDTIEITGAERACVVLLDANADLQVRMSRSTVDSAKDVGLADLSQTVIQRVIEARGPLLLHDVFDDQELMGRPSITSLSLRSILCVPMIRGETLFGVLYADSASAAGSFDQVDQEVLLLFAEQAAAALETHRLVADLQNSMAELKAMQERLVRGERLRTMGELSSGVAHEFNNLLTSILARVQLIGLTHRDVELRRDLGLIERACLDAAEVVRRLQTFARKQRQSDFVETDMAEVCRDAVELLRPLWSTRRRHGRPVITVQLRVEPNLAVRGHPTELREVITNLIKNALDALSDGGEIRIRAEPAGDSIRVSVADDGPGIPVETQARIFDAFFTTKGERGTGLGLCLAQQIVERHGGRITLSSRPGNGSSFMVELPAASLVQDVAPQGHGTNSDRPRILVIDDDEQVRQPLGRYLETQGYEVSTAASGPEGLAIAETHPPAIVISDISMAGMSGLEVCEHLTREYPEVRTILMTGLASGADAARAARSGAAALLRKPFALRQMGEAVTTCLNRRDGTSASTRQGRP